MFEYIGGHAALDFVNTVSWRRAGLANERFESFDDLVRWARGARLISPRSASTLRTHAHRRPAIARREMKRALRVREHLHQLLGSLARRRLDRSALRRFNRLLAPALRRLALTPRLSWELRGSAATQIVDLVIWETARLLMSDDRKTLGTCANPDCGWLYLDHSRRGNRRWCSMDACGSRAKMRRYYRRVKKGRR